MEENRSGRRSKKEIAPKVTHTKITISKSTPFLISKHHLDDTQMRNALNYDDQTAKNNHQRTYSYKGEVISCVNSKIKERFETFQSPSNPIVRVEEKEKRDQYYPQMHNKLVQVQSRVLKSRVKSNHTSSSKINKNTEVRIAIDSSNKQANDYGMQQKMEQRIHLKKQAQKLAKKHKKNVEQDLKYASINKIADLQDEIKHIKIKNLQLQKQRLLNDFQKTKQIINSQTSKTENINIIESRNTKHYTFNILKKPRFRIKHEDKDDTDSSFSSFQLQ